MPGVAKDPDNPLLTEDQIRAIAAYERSLEETYGAEVPNPYETTETVSPPATPAPPTTEESE